MAMYWSPSERRFIQSGQSQPQQQQTTRQSSPTQGGSRPQVYYSPSKGFLHSFDGQNVATKPKGYDEDRNQTTLRDILSKMQGFSEQQQRMSELAPQFSDLNAKNQEKATRAAAAGVTFKEPRKPNFLERVLDVASRPLYSSANVFHQQATMQQDRAQHWRQNFEGSLSEHEKRQIEQLSGKRLDEWFQNPSRLSGPGTSGIMRKYDRAIRDADQAIEGPGLKDMARAAGRGFTGKDKTTFRNVADQIDPFAPNWAKAGVGFVGDVFLDPLILVPGYVFTKPFSASANVVKGAVRKGRPTGQAIDRSVTAVRESGRRIDELEGTAEAWRGHFERQLDEGVLDSKLFDTAFDASGMVTRGERIKAANKLSRDLTGQYGVELFGEFFESNLNLAVQAGRISQEVADTMLAGAPWQTLDEAVQAAQAASQARASVLSTSPAASSLPAPPAGGASPAAGGAPALAAPAPVAQAEALDQAREFVRNVMFRGRVSQAVSTAPEMGRPIPALKEIIEDINKRIGANPNIVNHISEARTAASRHIAGEATRWGNAMERFINTGKLGVTGTGSQRVVRSLENIMKATDGGVKRAIAQALGKRSNRALVLLNRLVDDYMATVARPSFGDDAYRAWHMGLFRHIETGMRTSVVEDIAEAIVKSGADLSPALPTPGVASGAQSVTQTATQTAPEAVSQAATQAATHAPSKVDTAAQQLGPAVPDDVKKIIDETKKQVLERNKDFRAGLLDFIARADALGIDKPALKSAHSLDQAMGKAVERDMGVKAEGLFNKAINGFNRLFVPRAGLDDRINEMRLRYMGNANENIQYRARQLRELFKGTNKKDRIADLNLFRRAGVMSPRMQQWDRQLTDILQRYEWHRVPHAYGVQGSFTIGDINRWLPEKWKFLDTRGKEIPKDNIFRKHREDLHREPIRTGRDVIRALMEVPNVDPMEALWHFTIANEKALTEKATLHALAGIFGVTKQSTAGTALITRSGYVKNKKFGDEVYFHPEVSRQIDELFRLVHSPRANNKFISFLDGVNNVYKQMVTSLNPVGFNVRNSMGDAFTGYLDGVSGARGLASHRQALKLMRLQKKMTEQAREGVHKVGATQDDLGNVRQALFRLSNGTSVSVEETVALYNKFGLNSGFIQTDFGPHASNLRPGANPVRTAIEPLQNLAQNQADFFRYAHFIDRMKRSKAKDLNGAAQEAAEAVRKFKFDYNDFTPFEKQVMSRIIPFYKFSRKNLPLMSAMLFAQPHKMMAVPKGLTAISGMMGYEPEGFMPDYSADSVLPEWIQNQGRWPIGEWQGDTIYARPDIQMFDLTSVGTDGISGLTERVSPIARLPAELGSGQRFFGNELSPIGEGKPGTWSAKHTQHLLGQFPQVRMGYQHSQDEGFHPGRVAQWAGLGTVPNTDQMQEQQISMGWARFFETPEGQEFLKNSPPPEISLDTVRYFLDLMAQQNSLERR